MPRNADRRNRPDKMAAARWEDLNGRSHYLYGVRSNRGDFFVVEYVRNYIVADGFASRDAAWDYLNETEA